MRHKEERWVELVNNGYQNHQRVLCTYYVPGTDAEFYRIKGLILSQGEFEGGPRISHILHFEMAKLKQDRYGPQKMISVLAFRVQDIRIWDTIVKLNFIRYKNNSQGWPVGFHLLRLGNLLQTELSSFSIGVLPLLLFTTKGAPRSDKMSVLSQPFKAICEQVL